MSLQSLIYRSLPLTAVFAATASTLGAQGRQLFEWRGEVDREVQITMRGRDIWTRDYGNNERRWHREQLASPLPRQDGQVMVRLEDGRGDAEVVQQPSSRNDYTTIVRVRDPRGGADRYRLEAFWQSYSNSNGNWGRDRNDADVVRGRRNGDRGRDGDYNDDRDRGVYGRDRGVDTRDRSGGGWGANNGARNVLHWSGNVDDVLEIRLQGQRVDYRTISGSPVRVVQADANGIPQRDLQLSVSERQGRGQVYVVQQPSSRNGYTAVIRVQDPQAGYGFYDFDLTW